MPGLWPTDVDYTVLLLSVRVKCSVDELFKAMWIDPELSAQLHKLRNDTNLVSTSWVAAREHLPQAQFTWEPPAGGGTEGIAASRWRKVRFESPPAAMATKPFNNEETQLCVEHRPRTRYIVEIQANTSAPYGDKFDIYFRTTLSAESPTTSLLHVNFHIHWSPAMNRMMKGMISKAIESGVRGTYRTYRQVMEATMTVEDVPEASLLALATPAGTPAETMAVTAAIAASAAAAVQKPAVAIEAAGRVHREPVQPVGPLSYAYGQLVWGEQVTVLSSVVGVGMRSAASEGVVARVMAAVVTLSLVHMLVSMLHSVQLFCSGSRGLLWLLCLPITHIIDIPDSLAEVVVSLLLVAVVNYTIIWAAHASIDHTRPAAEVEAHQAAPTTEPVTETPVAPVAAEASAPRPLAASGTAALALTGAAVAAAAGAATPATKPIALSGKRDPPVVQPPQPHVSKAGPKRADIVAPRGRPAAVVATAPAPHPAVSHSRSLSSTMTSSAAFSTAAALVPPSAASMFGTAPGPDLRTVVTVAVARPVSPQKVDRNGTPTPSPRTSGPGGTTTLPPAVVTAFRPGQSFAISAPVQMEMSHMSSSNQLALPSSHQAALQLLSSSPSKSADISPRRPISVNEAPSVSDKAPLTVSDAKASSAAVPDKAKASSAAVPDNAAPKATTVAGVADVAEAPAGAATSAAAGAAAVVSGTAADIVATEAAAGGTGVSLAGDNATAADVRTSAAGAASSSEAPTASPRSMTGKERIKAAFSRNKSETVIKSSNASPTADTTAAHAASAATAPAGTIISPTNGLTVTTTATNADGVQLVFGAQYPPGTILPPQGLAAGPEPMKAWIKSMSDGLDAMTEGFKGALGMKPGMATVFEGDGLYMETGGGLLSRMSGVGGPDTIEEEVFENERFQPFRGWGHMWPGHFLPSDSVGHWSDASGGPGGSASMIFEQVEPSLPPEWSWLDEEWQLDMEGLDRAAVDDQGWTYALDFNYLKHPPPAGTGKCSLKHFVRRRRWFRNRIRIASRQFPVPEPPFGMDRGALAGTSSTFHSVVSSPGAGGPSPITSPGASGSRTIVPGLKPTVVVPPSASHHVTKSATEVLQSPDGTAAWLGSPPGIQQHHAFKSEINLRSAAAEGVAAGESGSVLLSGSDNLHVTSPVNGARAVVSPVGAVADASPGGALNSDAAASGQGLDAGHPGGTGGGDAPGADTEMASLRPQTASSNYASSSTSTKSAGHPNLPTSTRPNTSSTTTSVTLRQPPAPLQPLLDNAPSTSPGASDTLSKPGSMGPATASTAGSCKSTEGMDVEDRWGSQDLSATSGQLVSALASSMASAVRAGGGKPQHHGRSARHAAVGKALGAVLHRENAIDPLEPGSSQRHTRGPSNGGVDPVVAAGLAGRGAGVGVVGGSGRLSPSGSHDSLSSRTSSSVLHPLRPGSAAQQ